MEMANILLKQLRDIKTTQVQRKPASITSKPEPSPPIQQQGPPQLPPIGLQYPSSPAPAAQPPPGTYNVPVPADSGYAAPTRQDQASQSPYPPQHPAAMPKPSIQPGRPSYEQQPPPRHEPSPVRPSPPQQPSQPDYRSQQVVPVAKPTPAPVPAKQVVKARKVGLEDFDFLAVLGKGNFGKVMLAEEKRSRSLYAIKVLKKEFIIENDEVERLVIASRFATRRWKLTGESVVYIQHAIREAGLHGCGSRTSPFLAGTSFLLPDRDTGLLCHGVHQWRRSHVAHPEEAVHPATGEILRL